jgi:hypothetical protein
MDGTSLFSAALPTIQTENEYSYDGAFPPFVCMLVDLGLTRLLGQFGK